MNRGAFKHSKKLGTSQESWYSGEVEGKLPIMFLAYVSRVLDRFLDYIVDVLVIRCQIVRSRDDDPYTYGLRANDSHIVGVRLEGVQCNV